jgi:hypothetical protein
MSSHPPLPELHPATLMAAIPLHERVVDRLAELMLDANDLLGMLDGEDASSFLWLEPHVRRVYDEVHAVMLKMTD